MGGRMNTSVVYGSRAVLMVSLLSETATALTAILAPSILAWLLFGRDVDALTQQIVRFAGLILLALVAAIWPRGSNGAPQPTAALLLYNVLCMALLAYVGLVQGLHGLLLWPAVIAHAVIAVAQWATRRPPAATPSISANLSAR